MLRFHRMNFHQKKNRGPLWLPEKHLFLHFYCYRVSYFSFSRKHSQKLLMDLQWCARSLQLSSAVYFGSTWRVTPVSDFTKDNHCALYIIWLFFVHLHILGKENPWLLPTQDHIYESKEPVFLELHATTMLSQPSGEGMPPDATLCTTLTSALFSAVSEEEILHRQLMVSLLLLLLTRKRCFSLLSFFKQCRNVVVINEDILAFRASLQLVRHMLVAAEGRCGGGGGMVVVGGLLFWQSSSSELSATLSNTTIITKPCCYKMGVSYMNRFRTFCSIYC